MGFDFEKDDKKKLNYLIFKFSPKLSISFLGGMLLSKVTKYKISSFFQMFILLAIEEYINSFVPKWKDERKITKAKDIQFSGKSLNPAIHFFQAQELEPAHHKEL